MNALSIILVFVTGAVVNQLGRTLVEIFSIKREIAKIEKERAEFVRANLVLRDALHKRGVPAPTIEEILD